VSGWHRIVEVERSGGWTRPLLPRSSNRATTRKQQRLATSVSGLKVVTQEAGIKWGPGPSASWWHRGYCSEGMRRGR